MKSKRKALIAAAAVLAVLVCAIALLSLAPQKGDESERKIYELIKHDDDDVKSVVISNEKGEYTVTKTGGEMVYSTPGLAGLPQTKENYYDLIHKCAVLTASHKLKASAEDYGKYGLDSPCATASIEYESGEKATIHIGDSLKSEGFTYFLLEGDEHVYAGSENQFSYYFGDESMLLNTALAPGASLGATGQGNMSEPDYLRFPNKDGVEYIIETTDSFTDGYGNTFRHLQQSPKKSFVDAAKLKEVFPRIMEFSADSAYIMHPTKQQLDSFAFDKPYTYIDIGIDGKMAKISIVKYEGGYLAYKEGVDVIWKLADYLITWLDVESDTLTSHYFAAPSMAQLFSLSVEVNGSSYLFERLDGDFACRGETINKSSWEQLYKLACSVNSYNSAEYDMGGNVAAKLVFLLESGEKETVELRQTEARTLGIFINGKNIGYTLREVFAERLAEGCENALAGKSVSASW
ncbi:MAG: DUF4340 domain-containing protein [Oscillospiraceae bacterium]